MTKSLQSENNIIMRASQIILGLFILNILTVLCSIPIITVGAALAALHDGLIRIIRKEDGYIARRYFTVFKDSLKQSIILWIPFFLIFAGVIVDIFICLVAPGMLPNYIFIPAMTSGIIALFFFQWVFPVFSRFEGSIDKVFKTAFFLAGARLPRTLAMTMMWVIPIIASKFIFTLPVVVLFGISLPAMLCTLFYYPVFAELEQIEDMQNNKQAYSKL